VAEAVELSFLAAPFEGLSLLQFSREAKADLGTALEALPNLYQPTSTIPMRCKSHWE